MTPLLAELQAATLEAAGRPLDVLEAGGGSATALATLPRSLRFVTIDISADQLARNNYAAEKIHADLEDVDLEDVDLGARRFEAQSPTSSLRRLALAASCSSRVRCRGPRRAS